MKNKVNKLVKELKTEVGKGLKQEYHETKEIPKHIRNGDYRKAGEQIVDVGKMTLIVVIWVLPFGVIISGVVIRYFKRIKPSAFKKDDKEQE